MLASLNCAARDWLAFVVDPELHRLKLEVEESAFLTVFLSRPEA